jgi:hypothetical protein
MFSEVHFQLAVRAERSSLKGTGEALASVRVHENATARLSRTT